MARGSGHFYGISVLLTKTFRNLPVNVLSQCGGGGVEEVEGVFPEEIDGGEIVPSV